MAKLLGNPKAGVALSLLLAADAFCFASLAPVHIGWLCLPIAICISPMGGSRRPDAPFATIWKDGNDIRLTVSPGSVHPPSHSAQYVGDCFAWISPNSRGLVAPVLTYDDVDFVILPQEQPLEPEQLERVYAAYAELLTDWDSGKYSHTDYPELVSSGGGDYEHWSLGAALHDAIFILLLPPALTGVWAAGILYLHERRVLKAERGRCPYCCYDIRGIAGVCPECGHAIPRRCSGTADARGRSQSGTHNQ